MNQNETDSNNTAPELLRQGLEAMDDRAASRDNPGERSMARTVKAFNALTGRDLTEEEGWAFMVCLKEARALGGSKKVADDYIDGAAYFALQGECAVRQEDCDYDEAIEHFGMDAESVAEANESPAPQEDKPVRYVERHDKPFTVEQLVELGVPTTGRVRAQFCEEGLWVEGNLYTTPNGELRFRAIRDETTSYGLPLLWAIGFD